MAKRSAPEVNAGSMADIAFLLLIFFLVTTDIATDSGLNRKLPPWEPPTDIDVKIKQRNIFQITVNKHDQIQIKTRGDDKVIELKELRGHVVSFLDNGGGQGEDACRYCKGDKHPESSDNFNKAVVSLGNDRLTKYETYISVQNEVIAAYNELRNREFQREYPSTGLNYVQANDMYQDPQTSPEDKEDLKEKLEKIKKIIPQIFSEAETKKG
ncbi:ExbD/TolR family protein [Pontimicrobium sp. MEBiC06410]